MRNLTTPNPELESAELRTPHGMAHWSGTGPKGKTCGDCANYGYWYENKHGDQAHHPAHCALYWKRMHKHGTHSLPPSTPSCKYFDGGS